MPYLAVFPALCDSNAMDHEHAKSGEKIALVTGASRGLGAAMAEGAGARGYHVIAVARTTGALEELDDRIRAAGGAAATLAPMDVIEAPAMMQLAGAIAGRWGRDRRLGPHRDPCGPWTSGLTMSMARIGRNH